MAEKIILPITDACSRPQCVPDHFKLADALQMALGQLGDGFFRFKGTMVVEGSTRNIADLNAEVVPGTGLNVKIRDCVALVDGIVLGNKNKEQFAPTTFVTLNVASAVGATKYILAKPNRVVGSDGFDRPDFDTAAFELANAAADIDSGKITVAKLVVPGGTTQILASMIDNSVKDYLLDVDALYKELNDKISECQAGVSLEIVLELLAALTVQLRTEIADGDAGVLAQLNSDVAALNLQISDIQGHLTAHDQTIEEIQEAIAALWIALGNFQVYVNLQLADLSSRTGSLETWVDNLQHTVDQDAIYIADLQVRVSAVEGEIVGLLSNLSTIQINLQTEINDRINNDIAVKEGRSGGLILSNSVNLADTNFKVDALLNVMGNSLSKGWVDVLNSSDDVDPAVSTQWLYDSALKRVYVDPVLIPAPWPKVESLHYIFPCSEPPPAGWIQNVAGWLAGCSPNAPYIAGSPGNTGRWPGIMNNAIGNASNGTNLANIYVTNPAYGMNTSTGSYAVGGWYKFQPPADWPWYQTPAQLLWWRYTQRAVMVYPGQDKIVIRADGVDQLTAPCTIWDGNWHHIYMTTTYPSGPTKLYIEGVKVAENAGYYFSNPTTLTAPIFLGGVYTNLGYTWPGLGDAFTGHFSMPTQLTDDDVLAIYYRTAGPAVHPGAVVISKAHTAGSAPASILLNSRGSAGATYKVSRDDGTTWTDATPGVVTDVSGQPSGTAVRYKATLPTVSDYLDDVAVFWS